MTRDEIVNAIMQRLGQRTDLQSAIETELPIIQSTKLEGHQWLPWFLTTEMENNTTVAGEERISVPEDFLLEVDDQALWVFDSNANEDSQWVELVKDDLDFLTQKYPGTGKPVGYSLVGNYFIFRPIPNDAYALRLRCFATDEALTTNIENQWTKHAADVVIYETCAVMAREYIKDMESAQGFEARAKEAWDRLYRKHVARDEANRMRQMGED